MAADIYNRLKGEDFLKALDKPEFISRLAYYMGEINALHPFREATEELQEFTLGCCAKIPVISWTFIKSKKKN